MILRPRNWQSFQHYKDRSPAWIKLHRGLLNDFEFSRLPIASKALAPLLWVLASEYQDGAICASLDEIAFRIHVSRDELDDGLKPLINAGFFSIDSGAEHDASTTLAEPEHDASEVVQSATLEKRREREREEKEKKVPRADATRASADDRKSRKRPSAPLPSPYPIPPQIETFAAERGFTTSEKAREHERFCNHAQQNDRRCVDWIAAERNWFIGAAERAGKAPPVEAAKAAEALKSMYYAAFGSPQLDAWDAHYRRTTGKGAPRDTRGGWYVASEWPPGYSPPTAPDIPRRDLPALTMQGM